jgi:APA family basic amino acid/polyamine antiporter
MIGTGIFTTSGFVMEALRDPLAMLVCWFIGGVFALCGALCYGELGAVFPRAGGEYVFLRESFGKWMAFLSGWISLIVGFSAPIAAASIAFAGYFFRSFPNALAQNPDIPFFDAEFFSFSPVTMLAVGIILIFSLVHNYSLHFGSRVQNVLTLFKIAVILAFILAGLAFGNGSLKNFGPGFDSGLIFSGSFATSLIFITFAYSGWNAAAYLGGEIREPGRSIPFALLTGTFIVAALYLLLNMTFIYALPMNEMSGVLEVGAKSAVSLFGSQVGRVFTLAVTLCLLSVISAMIMTGPRVYYAMAKDGTFFGLFARVSKTRRTPGPSIALQAAIAVGMVLTSSFDKLLLYIGFTLSLFAMLTVAGMMLLRIKKTFLERPYKTIGYPITPILFILGNLWIIVFCIKGHPMVSLYAAGTIAIGSLVYGYFANGDGKADLREEYDESEALSKRSKDLNVDGKPDVEETAGGQTGK